MSLQWTFVATFLYFEIFLCIMLMLPFISCQRWQKIFRSRMLAMFRSYADIYFNIFIVILILLFIDSIRDMKKYTEAGGEIPDLSNNPMAESINNMKLFRAQRNFYIAGFALFLFVVLRKLVTMISAQAQLTADCEASKKQAESASAAAARLLEEKSDAKGDDGGETNHLENELKEAKVKITDLRNELEKSKSDLSAMKKQTEATHREYDRLSGEYASLQREHDQLKGEGGDKKDD